MYIVYIVYAMYAVYRSLPPVVREGVDRRAYPVPPHTIGGGAVITDHGIIYEYYNYISYTICSVCLPCLSAWMAIYLPIFLAFFLASFLASFLSTVSTDLPAFLPTYGPQCKMHIFFFFFLNVTLWHRFHSASFRFAEIRAASQQEQLPMTLVSASEGPGEDRYGLSF